MAANHIEDGHGVDGSLTAAAPSRAERPDLAIHLFGQMEVAVYGRPVSGLPSRRASWLLAILALRKGSPIERQVLAGLLWPDSPDSVALHNLRQTLFGLRRALGSAGDSIVTVSPRSVVLRPGPGLWVDALEFDGLVMDESVPALERAIELYRGPLLDRWDEPLAVEEREARERAFVEAAGRLASQYASRQDHARAIETLRRAIVVDPYRETTARALMLSLADSGEAAAALDHYRGLRSRLRRHLNALPDSETTGLYRAIRSSSSVRSALRHPRPSHEPNMPTHLSTLLGRKGEISEVASLVGRCRLVTLTGFGGVGKTRLAIAVGTATSDEFVDGVRFVDLSPLQDPRMVPSAIATALRLQEQADPSILGTIEGWLRPRELILVIDNCEHLTSGVVPAVEAMLSASAGLHILATSRQSLGVLGEHVWRVPPLETPLPVASNDAQVDNAARSELLLRTPSVQLFLERSGVERPAGPLATIELELIGSICRRLEGIPLAIELAAARTKVLTVSEIEARLEDRFALLSGGNRSLARHQTLRAAIEWSWDLLTETERRMMLRLCVFRGGCSLEAAEAVSSEVFEGDGDSTLDLIANLVDRSLLNSNPHADGSRFSMLESIRQYATDRLRETPDWELDLDRHRDFFLNWAEEAKPKQQGPEQMVWFARMEVEHDNLRAALAWSHQRKHDEKALRLAVAMSRFWDTHGHLREGRGLLEASLDRATSAYPPSLVAAGHGQAGWMATVQGDCQAAREHYELALSIYEEDQDLESMGGSLNGLASANYYSGDCETAIAQYERALAIFRTLGMHGMIATVLNNLGEVALHLNDIPSARRYLEQSIVEAGGLDSGSPQRRGLTLCNLSLAELRERKYDEAHAHAREALRLFQSAAVIVAIPGALNQIGVVLTRLEKWERAAKLLGASESHAVVQGVPLANLLAREREEASVSARRALGEEAFQVAFARGAGMTVDDAVALALEEFSPDTTDAEQPKIIKPDPC